MTILTLAATPSFDPGRTLVYSPVDLAETDALTIEVPTAEGGRIYTKVRVLLTNASFDYMALFPAEVVFLYPQTSLPPTLEPHQEKARVVRPWDTRYVSLAVGGVDGLDVNAFDIDFNGLFRVPAAGDVVPAPRFDPTAQDTNFAVGEAFGCRGAQYERDERWLDMTIVCKYQGERVGLIETTRPTLQVEGGRLQGYKNRDEGQLPWLLRPGEPVRFHLRFRLPRKLRDAGPGSFRVDFGNTFMESDLVPLDSVTVRMEIDELKTANLE
ncbi:MAG: hypothetical protein H6740_00920 [Alphaproteobacteria bacterium]|nr:hypothetical protein [Alphaproteobacteria bacterium]